MRQCPALSESANGDPPPVTRSTRSGAGRGRAAGDGLAGAPEGCPAGIGVPCDCPVGVADGREGDGEAGDVAVGAGETDGGTEGDGEGVPVGPAPLHPETATSIVTTRTAVGPSPTGLVLCWPCVGKPEHLQGAATERRSCGDHTLPSTPQAP